MQVKPVKKKAGKFWLYGPTILLILLAVGWSAGWFYLRDKAVETLDRQIAREGAMGRNWTCANRSIGGFPFRYELNCEPLLLRNGPVSFQFGKTSFISQVYDPKHVIIVSSGPLRAGDGTMSIAADWQALEASIILDGTRPEQISVSLTKPSFTVTDHTLTEPVAFSSDGADFHLRPTPGSPETDNSFDLAFNSAGTVIPMLNAWMGDNEPVDISSEITVTKFEALKGRSIPEVLEAWRSGGGLLKIEKLHTMKGLRALNFRGYGGIDLLHRAEAKLELSQANYSDLMARLLSSDRSSEPLRPVSPGAANSLLVPLPQVQLKNGKVYVGPLAIPGVRLPALY